MLHRQVRAAPRERDAPSAVSIIVDDRLSLNGFGTHNKSRWTVGAEPGHGANDTFSRNIHWCQSAANQWCGRRLNPGAPRGARGCETYKTKKVAAIHRKSSSLAVRYPQVYEDRIYRTRTNGLRHGAQPPAGRACRNTPPVVVLASTSFLVQSLGFFHLIGLRSPTLCLWHEERSLPDAVGLN